MEITNVSPPEIIISEELKNKIKEYSKTDLSRELAGILVGEISTNNNVVILNVDDIIFAEHTESRLSSVKFTSESWLHINNTMDEKFPDKKMIGWFHTHPGFGIFLSNWDLFIHQNFFNLKWQIAYVVDPIHKTDGFFGWGNNEIVRIDVKDNEEPPVIDENNEFYDELNELNPIETIKNKNKFKETIAKLKERIKKDKDNQKSKKTNFLSIAILLILIGILIIIFYNLPNNFFSNIKESLTNLLKFMRNPSNIDKI